MPAGLDRVKPTGAMQGVKGHLWEQLYLPAILHDRVLWSPGNTGPLGVGRQVVTVHDLATLDHPEWFEKKFAIWYRTLLPRLIKKVHAVIAVSEFSKQRILALTQAGPDRIHVIHNGVDTVFQPATETRVQEAKQRYQLQSPYLLYLGSLEPRKNLGTLLKAWRLGDFHGATLAVAGAGSQLFAKFDMGAIPEGVQFIGAVSDECLPALYSGAAGFVYPSLYEGFSLPPLEALACGCPVAISDIPVHREVCGTVADYFSPFDPGELSSRLEQLLTRNEKDRKLVGERGVRHAARYTWESSASKTWQLLESTVLN